MMMTSLVGCIGLYGGAKDVIITSSKKDVDISGMFHMSWSTSRYLPMTDLGLSRAVTLQHRSSTLCQIY